jgi:hypothetical protein
MLSASLHFGIPQVPLAHLGRVSRAYIRPRRGHPKERRNGLATPKIHVHRFFMDILGHPKGNSFHLDIGPWGKGEGTLLNGIKLSSNMLSQQLFT